ncbi:MAG TPA: 2-amino-4-hydroxy-6-hydroxymethyldihydropteridine diphosphokinase [Burkholderiales bacterium]|nr:2-amino-4-hydroxy-6-hydroxymethyldihydropteridine diphosphokinase [Burkholderiales bacterium]
MTIAYVGIGSNLDDPRAHVTQAFDELDRLPHTRVVKKSSLYRSAPLGYADQPDFINAVAQLETGLPAERLLAELQEVEARHGRARSFPNAPRTLDLDLLLYGTAKLNTKTLQVPHPRMHERAFVLKPLLEIAPHLPFEPPHDQKVERIA